MNPNATATIIIGGLSLCHRNKKNDTWEVLFIRDEKNFHDLKIKIGYENKQTEEISINQGDEIAIKVTSPKSSTDSYNPTPTFERSHAVDVINDLRWILDFSSKEMHGEPLEVKKRPRDNFFYTPNALFYTLSLSGKHYLLQKTDSGNPVGEPVLLQDIGEFAAGDIECEEDGTITIEIKAQDGNITKYPLKKGAEVFFDNRCLTHAAECENDFPHYYDVIRSGTEKFEIKYSPTLIEKWTESSFLLRGYNYACECGRICHIKDPNDSLNN